MIEHLTELQYSNEREGRFALYIYESNSDYHRGPVWFMKKPIYPEEGEITISEARDKVTKAILEGREIRIVDTGDMLVFHGKDGKVLYPNDGEKFWVEIAE